MFGEKSWKDMLPPPAHEERTPTERFLNKLAWAAFLLFTGFVVGYTLGFHHYAN
jgi:hypothetical protein